MILASHNSWSFLPPKHGYMRPFRFMAKCQSLSILEQFAMGARVFDLRVHFTESGQISFRHGFMEYDLSLSKLLEDLHMLEELQRSYNYKAPVIIRILLEQTKPHKTQQAKIDQYFIDFCDSLKRQFPVFKFTGGRRKYDWKKIAFVNNDSYEGLIIEKYSSVTSFFSEDKNLWYGILDDFWPWLYAKTHNKKLKKKYQNEENKFLMLDFIQYAR